MFELYRRYLKKYTGFIILGSFLKVLEAIWELIVPFIIRYMIDNVVNDNLLSNDTKIYRLLMCGLLLLILAVLGIASTVCAQKIAAKTSHAFGTDLRKELFKHINTLSFKELDKISSASLVTRLQSDCLNVQNSVSMIIRLILRAPFIVIGSTIMSFIIQWRLGLVFLGFTLVLYTIIFFIMFYLIPKSKNVQQKLDVITKITQENLRGSRIVRAFNKQRYEYIKFVDNQEKLTNIQQYVGTVDALLNPLTFLLVNIASIIVCYISGLLFTDSLITQGDIQAAMNYFTQIQLALVAVTDLAIVLAKASASSGRVLEVLNLKTSMQFGKEEALNFDKDPITFSHVSFSYNDDSKLAITDVSFTIKAGETIGIIGCTGSGKSTIVNLLNRFYDPQKGDVFLYGKNIREYNKDALNRSIATVMQKSVAFTGSIKSNILKGNPNANDDEINKVLSLSCCNFVNKFEDGISHEILQNGANISGGQNQRLLIARALIKKSPILVLDDSSSALDYKTEKELHNNISHLNKTTIIVSQRPNSIIHADRILVFNEGRLIACDSHQKLYQNCSLYREICLSQDVGVKNYV